MTKKQKIQQLLKGIMEDISYFERTRHKFIGLEISAVLINFLLVRNEDDYYILAGCDRRVVEMGKAFIQRIKNFVETEGDSNELIKFIIGLLLEKTSRLGCLQIQNPQHFDPDAKMTRQ